MFTVKKIDANDSNETIKTFFASDKRRFCLWQWCSSIPIVCKLVLSTPNIFIWSFCYRMYSLNLNLSDCVECARDLGSYTIWNLVRIVWATSNIYAKAFKHHRQVSIFKESSDFEKVYKSNYSIEFRLLSISKKKNRTVFWICERNWKVILRIRQNDASLQHEDNQKPIWLGLGSISDRLVFLFMITKSISIFD